MEQELFTALADHLSENYPEVALMLPMDVSVTQYLWDKVHNVLPLADQLSAEGMDKKSVISSCLDAMTVGLQPSRYQYINGVMKDEFPQEYEELEKEGVLKFEILTLIEVCAGTFESFSFSHQTLNSNLLRHAIIAVIHHHIL
ncbi:hypothetical protein [Chitinophaga barathri]|uniref:Uncharacterized protein n=1 Tax=Chitinophaga barathri TaxID=1647451 RepID=A0A3N4M7V0_9BACT|nr:hypothetical protein [Chitinophaga barathri]RPD39335.1 hypothetical protein EG028_19610 [Chitinophaga barathri]